MFSSCELQEDVIEKHNHQEKVKLSTKRFSELITEKKFSTAFSKIPKKRIIKINASGRTEMEDKYGFTIFDTPVNIIESDSLIAYNLLIKRDTPSEGSYVENLVMNIFPQENRTDAYIIKYVFDGTTEINPENFFELEKKPIVTPIVFNNEPFDEEAKQGMGCIRLQEYQCCILGGEYTGCHTPNSGACVGNWITVDVLCNTSAGSGGSYDYSGTGGGSGGNGGSGGGSTGNPHPGYTNPNPPCDPRVNCPVFEEEGKSTCEILTEAKNEPKVQQAIDFLKTKTTGEQEFAYEIYRKYNYYTETNDYETELRVGTNYNIIVRRGNHIQGQTHNHPIDQFAIPSWDDIYWTQLCEEDNTNFNNGTAYNIVVSPDPANPGGTILYAVTIDNLTALQQATDAVFNLPRILAKPTEKLKREEIMKVFGDKFATLENDTGAQEKTFLQTFASYGITLSKFNEQTGK